MGDQRLQRPQNLPAVGDVDALFSTLEVNPYVLEDIDKIPFVTTPLHTAAREGKIHLAKEILNLMPSFASKRDHLGRSPLHLALEGRHLQEGLSPRDLDLERKYQEVVTWLIKHDSGLVRVKARGMVTPLHYVAQLDDEFNLKDFLYVCPSSIEDLTVKSETAVHVALKNQSFKAFKVLLGWLQLFNQEQMLYWEDEEGNNALHTAVFANQPEAVKLLIRCMEVNIKNSKGLTALDIFYDRQGQGLVDAAVRDILVAAKAKTASQLNCSPIRLTKKIINLLALRNPLVENFSGGLPFSQRFLKRFRLDYLSINKVPIEVRNILLVVAILIATATYQAALSPPGGYWQDNGNLRPAANNTGISNTTTDISNTTTDILNKDPNEHFAGDMVIQSSCQLVFLTFNSFAFCASLCLIATLVTGLPFYRTIISLMLFLAASYYFSLYETIDCADSTLVISVLFVFFLATYIIAYFLDSQYLKLRRHGSRRNLRLGSFEKPKM